MDHGQHMGPASLNDGAIPLSPSILPSAKIQVIELLPSRFKTDALAEARSHEPEGECGTSRILRYIKNIDPAGDLMDLHQVNVVV